MNEHYTLLNRYKSGRSALLVVIAFTAINSFLSIINADIQFLYSASIPQIAMAFKTYLANQGISPLLSMLMFVIIPIALLAISYLLSKNNATWFAVATGLMVIDLLVLLYFWIFVSKFNMGLLLNIVFEVVIVAYLIYSLIAGFKLKGDFSEADLTEQRQVLESRELYYSNDAYAKEHKANKNGLIIATSLGYVALVFVGSILLAMIGSDVTILLFILLFVGGVAAILYVSFKCRPFSTARNYAYFRENGILKRQFAYNPMYVEEFADFQVVEEKPDCYKCTYTTAKGKPAKLTIPKAYPGLENIL